MPPPRRPAKPRQPARARPVTRRRRWPWLAAAAVMVGVLIWLGLPFWQIARQFGAQPWQQPSRLYGRSTALVVGQAVGRTTLERVLKRAGYRQQSAGDLRTGGYRSDGGTVTVARRRFPTPRGFVGPDLLRIELGGGGIRALSVDGDARRRALLDPPLVASFYGADLQERRPVSVDELPEELVYAVLAAEDAGFLEHAGISISGVLRAAWANLRAGGVHQGGSTLTQQLIKNRYLTHERTWSRKIQEAILAVVIDARYAKRDILEAYLNEIYWGRSGSVDLMGVGAAAWVYFAKHPSQLDLAECALLAGIIRSPGSYSPRAHPDRALVKRDQVLDRLATLGWVDAAVIARAKEQPLGTVDRTVVARRAPFFAEAAAAEAAARFGLGELRDTGYVLLSTLDMSTQSLAEEAVTWGVHALEEGWEKDRRTDAPLEAALLSVDPRDGAILAYVGGRDYGRSQFDRIAQARRQAGSAFKPVVYAAAFRAGLSPASPVEDAPFTHVDHGRSWSPKNSDGQHRGWISSRRALVESLNVPTAKLALRVGMSTIAELAGSMGIESALDPYPALALGAMEVTPRELTSVYATLAAGGVRPEIHGLVGVLDRQGDPVPGRPLAAPERVLSPEIAYLVTDVLRDVLDEGTAQGVRSQGLEDRLAGKTGTTNSRRDSWFAGYGTTRVSLVWVGYDDNTRTRLSGARAAVPIWARFTHAVRPSTGFPDFEQPNGIRRAFVDPTTGQLATRRCFEISSELFTAETLPREMCPLHPGRPIMQPDGVIVEPERRRNPFRRWLDRVRGRKARNPDGTF